jgi:hypothetical protein
MTVLTLDDIEAVYKDGKGMEEFARAIERRVLEKRHDVANDICAKLIRAELDVKLAQRREMDAWHEAAIQADAARDLARELVAVGIA